MLEDKNINELLELKEVKTFLFILNEIFSKSKDEEDYMNNLKKLIKFIWSLKTSPLVNDVFLGHYITEYSTPNYIRTTIEFIVKDYFDKKVFKGLIENDMVSEFITNKKLFSAIIIPSIFSIDFMTYGEGIYIDYKDEDQFSFLHIMPIDGKLHYRDNRYKYDTDNTYKRLDFIFED